VVIARVDLLPAADYARQLARIAQLQHHMIVIRHQAPVVDGRAYALDVASHASGENRVVPIVVEDRLLDHAAVQDVEDQGVGGLVFSWSSGHGDHYSRGVAKVNN
jgi:hypothetical protein